MITDLDRKRAFKVQYDKTYDATNKIFDPIFEKVFQEVEILYQRCKADIADNCVYWVIVSNGTYLYRSEETIDKEIHQVSIKQQTGLFSFPSELEPEVEKLSVIVRKLHQDIRVIQQWLSIVIDENWSYTIKYICPIGRTLLGINSNLEYEIPKGKEKFWKTVEDLLQYYAGLRLVL